jgi:hypothetical protein
MEARRKERLSMKNARESKILLEGARVPAASDSSAHRFR